MGSSTVSTVGLVAQTTAVLISPQMCCPCRCCVLDGPLPMCRLLSDPLVASDFNLALKGRSPCHDHYPCCDPHASMSDPLPGSPFDRAQPRATECAACPSLYRPQTSDLPAQAAPPMDGALPISIAGASMGCCNTMEHLVDVIHSTILNTVQV